MTTSASYPSFAGRTIIVTGGASGIGASIVEHLAAQRARVGILDIDARAGADLCARIAEKGDEKPHFEATDLTDIDALKKSIAAVRAAFGPVTVLVNNAANDDRHELADVTPDYWDQRMAVNLKHQFFAAQAVYGDMRDAGGGAIINMGSVSWRLGQGGMVCYTTAKAAVEGLTRSLAREFGRFNIRVNTVLPGWVMTERQIELWLTDESERELMQNQCLQRTLAPADLARFVTFLASDQASAATAQSFIVDAGWV
ncbi:MAG: SDR family NAD(P)-dependent oxidoreductase [Hyphomicrobiales bacterium]